MNERLNNTVPTGLLFSDDFQGYHNYVPLALRKLAKPESSLAEYNRKVTL